MSLLCVTIAFWLSLITALISLTVYPSAHFPCCPRDCEWEGPWLVHLHFRSVCTVSSPSTDWWTNERNPDSSTLLPSLSSHRSWWKPLLVESLPRVKFTHFVFLTLLCTFPTKVAFGKFGPPVTAFFSRDTWQFLIPWDLALDRHCHREHKD